MLSECEREVLREIERGLRWRSPELVRLFNSTWPPLQTKHHRGAGIRVLVAGAALVGLMLRGPRMLNEAEAGAQQGPPLAAVSRLATIAARRTGSMLDSAVSVSAAVVDLSVDASTTRAAGACRARAHDVAVSSTRQARMADRLAERRAVCIGSSGPPSPSSADRAVRAESESSW